MLTKRIIPCLDVKEGRVVKGTNFVGLRDAGDPVERAAAYDAEGADELVCQMAMIFSIVCIILMVYSVALRSETAAYLAFFVLALPLISSKAIRSNGGINANKLIQRV